MLTFGVTYSATIESIVAERDDASTTKSLLATNKKNSSLSYSKMTSTNLADKDISNNIKISNSLTRSNSSLVGESKKLEYESSKDNNSCAPTRHALSSDDEYKTASEASATSNLSTDNVEFFDWGKLLQVSFF